VTTGAPPSVDELGRSLVRTTFALFLASFLLGPLLAAGARWLTRGLYLDPVTENAVIVAAGVAPLHFNLLSPLLAKWLVAVRARRRLPVESIFLVADDGATWRLFGWATLVTVAALAVSVSWPAGVFGDDLGGMLLAMALSGVLWPYRVIVVTRRWLRHVRSLPDSLGVLSREMAGYRAPARFFLDVVESRREVVLEREDGASLTLKYVDAARLAAEHGCATTGVEGVQEIWRAVGPTGAQAVAAWREKA